MPRVATLDSRRSGGGRHWYIEASFLTSWRVGSEWHDGCSPKGPGGLSPSCPQQWIAWWHVLVLPFPPLFTVPGSSLFFPGITAQSELLHTSLWIRLFFLRDCGSKHREEVRMDSEKEGFPQIKKKKKKVIWIIANSHIWILSMISCTPLVAQMVKHLPVRQETWVPSLGQEDPLEKGMATHSSVLAWRIPCTEESGRLQSMGCRVRHSWVTDSLFYIFADWSSHHCFICPVKGMHDC